MQAFFILKPDALVRKEVLNYYEQTISNQEFIKSRNQYLISSWVDLSCKLYNPIDDNLTKEQLIKLKHQLLTTIKAYDYLYKNKEAIIDIFDIPEDIIYLSKLEMIKYDVRQKFVLNTKKNYFKFNNLPKDILTLDLCDIKITDLEVSHICVGAQDEIKKEGYNLAYLNCIHFPDRDISSVEKDFEIIDNTKVLTKKIKL